MTSPDEHQRAPTVREIYARHFGFVWRNLRRLGVDPEALDDATQDVFLVIHRRLGDFDNRSLMERWIFGIMLRVTRDHRRSWRRRARLRRALGEATGGDAPVSGPFEHRSAREAAALLDEVLATLDENKRAVFALVELEQLPVTRAAEMLGVNLNTTYARLRAARMEVDAAVAGLAAREKAVHS